MIKKIEKKPQLIYNNIPDQAKRAANSLTIQEWNQVVNVLKQQANMNTEHLEKLHRFLFESWNADTTGYYEFITDIQESGVFNTLIQIIEEVRYYEFVHTGPDAPLSDKVTVWVEFDNEEES